MTAQSRVWFSLQPQQQNKYKQGWMTGPAVKIKRGWFSRKHLHTRHDIHVLWHFWLFWKQIDIKTLIFKKKLIMSKKKVENPKMNLLIEIIS